MYRSLSDLRQSVDRLIQEQGENAPCAAFIFTKEDVFNSSPFYYEEEKPDEDFCDDVLNDVGQSDYIYERIDEMIDDVVKDQVKRRTTV